MRRSLTVLGTFTAWQGNKFDFFCICYEVYPSMFLIIYSQTRSAIPSSIVVCLDIPSRSECLVGTFCISSYLKLEKRRRPFGMASFRSPAHYSPFPLPILLCEMHAKQYPPPHPPPSPDGSPQFTPMPGPTFTHPLPRTQGDSRGNGPFGTRP